MSAWKIEQDENGKYRFIPNPDEDDQDAEEDPKTYRMGWICPRCSQVWAPAVMNCNCTFSETGDETDG